VTLPMDNAPTQELLRCVYEVNRPFLSSHPLT